MFLNFLRLQKQPISDSRFLIFIDLHLLPSLHLLEINISQMRFKLLGVENEVVPINIALWFFIPLDWIFLRLFLKINNSHMCINCFVADLVLSHLRLLPLNIQILLKSFKFLPVLPILLKRHIIIAHNDIFGNFSPYFLQITIIE